MPQITQPGRDRVETGAQVSDHTQRTNGKDGVSSDQRLPAWGGWRRADEAWASDVSGWGGIILGFLWLILKLEMGTKFRELSITNQILDALGP